jgi:hypothetical protein
MGMKTLLIALFVCFTAIAYAETPTAPGDQELSIREQIKAARAKEKADEENGPKERPWDRDAEGRRPWEIPLKPLGALPKR